MANDIAVDIIENGIGQASQVTTAIIKLLDDLATNTKTHTYSLKDKQMVKELANYHKSGGNLLADDIDIAFAGVFEQLLRNKGIPFVAASAIDPTTKEQRVVFTTRDKDKAAVAQVREQYNFELNVGLGEMQPNKFLNLNLNQNIQSVSGLTPVELEVFRHNVTNMNLSYALDYDRKADTYSVLYSYKDEKNINDALTLTAYDLSGDKGTLVKENIERELDNRSKFKLSITPVQNQTLYVVDAVNPANFIAINQDNYSMHTLRAVKEKQQDGRIHEIIKDMADTKPKSFNKEEVLRLADNLLQRPVVLTQDEMKLVSNVDIQGKITLNNPNQFMSIYNDMSKKLAFKNLSLKHKKTMDELNPKNEITGLSNISDADINQIKTLVTESKIKGVSISGNQIAYTSEAKRQMQNILNSVLYEGLSPEKRFEAKCLYEERGNIDINSGNTYFIKDMRNPAYQFKLDADNFTIYNLTAKENGIKPEPIVISRGSAQFKDSVIPILLAMDNPVILNNEEGLLTPQERLGIEMTRMDDANALDARSLIIDNSHSERVNIISSTFDEREATEKQKKALGYVIKWPKQTYVVDRNFLEKIADHTLDQKKVENRARMDDVSIDR